MTSSSTKTSGPTLAKSRGRRLPIGAEPVDPGFAHFRVWAPAAGRVDVVVGNIETSLDREPSGYFSGKAQASSEDRYRFRLDGGRTYPDPASRFQPEGPHGPSQIVDPTAFPWTDDAWRGRGIERQVIYELHIGTFTNQGTWTAAARELRALADLGVTTIEVMPVAEFDGRFGWGYDGVDLFAPFHGYGTPDDFRRFVDQAHSMNLGVILDVVYNHLGPSGNYLRAYADSYFTKKYNNEWGEAINFDGPGSAPVRELFIANAGYWIDEFHLDGLRLDATQQIYDDSPEHVIAAIARQVRQAARGRTTILVAENEPQDTRLLRAVEDGGYGLDALWNDDFHHSAKVALTGRAEAYYSDTHGEPQEFISAAKYGFLFQGQFYKWQEQARGTPALEVHPARFIAFLQNHDQVANSVTGQRGHELTSPGKWRALTALLLLSPATPMLFQGQEFSASAPFLYFADFNPELAGAVRRGRLEFLSQFPSVEAFGESIPNPGDESTYQRCKLDFAERELNRQTYVLFVDLLQLRRQEPAFSAPRPGGVDGAVLSPAAFVLRFFTPSFAHDRLLIVNLGPELNRPSYAEPLLAPPAGTDWKMQWSSDEPRYGGRGSREPWTTTGLWTIPPECALVLGPGPQWLPRESKERRRSA